ncbi:MAG: hypothetical protein H6555_07395 [Lewinellaceae bacterium]|nr:hypothetical protein [Lewinellaceae bacterium]
MPNDNKFKKMSSLKFLYFFVLVVLVFVMITILIIDYMQVKKIKKRINIEWADKYYELKWRINLLLAIISITGVIGGLFGIPYLEDIKTKISDMNTKVRDLNNLTESITDRVNTEKERVDRTKLAVNEISKSNQTLRNDIEKNIEHIYSQVKEEEERKILRRVINNPQQIAVFENYIFTIENIPDLYYKDLKNSYSEILFNQNPSNSYPKKLFLRLFFQKFPHLVFNDFVIRKELETYETLLDVMATSSNPEVIQATRHFFNSVLKNDDLENNPSRIKAFVLSSIATKFSKTTPEKELFYYSLYSVLNNKGDKLKIWSICDYEEFRVSFGKLILYEYKGNDMTVDETSKVDIIEGVKDLIKNDQNPK